MPAKYFTLEEANDALYHIEPLVSQLLDVRAKAVRQGQAVKDVLKQRSGFGGPPFTQLTQEFNLIDNLIKEIESYGCVLKDINVGLLDFLAQKNGRDVYLCWRYGEDRIEFYHELHSGFQGRQPF